MSHHRRQGRTIIAALAGAAMLFACEGPGPPVGRADDVVPPDLTIDVIVLVGPPSPAPPSADATTSQPAAPLDLVQRRQGRYILFPDGTLHADVGRTLRADVRPGTTRRLTTEQVQSIWGAARRLGLASPEDGTPPGNDALVVAAPDQIVHIVTFQADGQSWRVVRRGAADGLLDPATTPFIRELAALAWISDDPPAARHPAVVRYDFGPDPYAMYRPPPPDEGNGPARDATPPPKVAPTRDAPPARDVAPARTPAPARDATPSRTPAPAREP
ncbi:MAG: hypothetical protein U0575_10940 [Phycisphaerales bacterium]